MKFDSVLEHVLLEEFDDNYRASIAIVHDGDRWLLGLSTAKDDRHNKWCHPGGGIKKGESPEKAAERECYEETGVKCRAVGKPFSHSSRKGIAFVPCKAKDHNNLEANSEFVALGFFTEREMRSLKLYDNVKDLIEKAKKC